VAVGVSLFYVLEVVMAQAAESARWIAVIFSSDGTISCISEESEQVTGHPPGSLVGHSITEILADESLFRLPDILGAAAECGNWSGDILHRHRGGDTVPAYAVFTRLSGSGGDKPAFLLISAFAGSGSEPMKGTHLREIGGKLREFAHQLNNPLAVVLGFTQLIMLSPQCVGNIRTDMEKVFTEMRRLVDVVHSLHLYAVGLQESPHKDRVLKTG
jgi:signal transduction histidine kinase